jgi:Glycosyl transferases group 1
MDPGKVHVKAMRFFQNSGVYPSYLARLDQLASKASSFEERRRIFLEDRYGALHTLKPALEGDKQAFFTNGDDEVLQRAWAREHGLPEKSAPDVILLAQIEHHRTEVFYNTDPLRFPSSFIRKLPGSVRKSICWRAVPSTSTDLTAYHAVLGNFPSIREFWRKMGCRSEVFYPAYDPVMDEYGHGERPIDVLFVGGYTRHHKARARTLEEVASLGASRHVVYCLDASRLTRLAESTIGSWLPLRKHRRPDAIARIAKPPVFGRQLYELIGSSKIVLNGAIDIAGVDRGNMRCFEAMGCGALLVSDAGNYPAGMEPGRTIEAYDSPERAASLVPEILRNWPEFAAEAARGKAEVTSIYSKALQWKRFADIVAAV